MLWRRGARRVSDLTRNDFINLNRVLDKNKSSLVSKAIDYPLGNPDGSAARTFCIGDKFKLLDKCTSKEIRLQRTDYQPLTTLKIGIDLTHAESLSWGHRLSKVTSAKHRNIILRVAHGDIYTNEKLTRFGLADDPSCPRCDQIETLRHKFIECSYVKRIWKEAFRVTRTILTCDPLLEDPTKAALGAYLGANTSVLIFNAELLQRIHLLKTDNYSLHPRYIVKSAAMYIMRNERNGACKSLIKSILDSMA